MMMAVPGPANSNGLTRAIGGGFIDSLSVCVRFYLPPPCVQGGSVRGKESPGNGCSQKGSGLDHEGGDAGGGFKEVLWV